jgi:hypothetical protein
VEIGEGGARLLRACAGVPRSAAARHRPRCARPWRARLPGPYATGRTAVDSERVGASQSRAPVPPRWRASADARGTRLRRLGGIPGRPRAELNLSEARASTAELDEREIDVLLEAARKNRTTPSLGRRRLAEAKLCAGGRERTRRDVRRRSASLARGRGRALPG